MQTQGGHAHSTQNSQLFSCATRKIKAWWQWKWRCPVCQRIIPGQDLTRQQAFRTADVKAFTNWINSMRSYHCPTSTYMERDMLYVSISMYICLYIYMSLRWTCCTSTPPRCLPTLNEPPHNLYLSFPWNPLFLLRLLIRLHPPTGTSETPAPALLRVLFLCCWRTSPHWR